MAHIGCGTGYYTALLAELVGPAGHVTAIELDGRSAASAARNLVDRGNVEVVQGDGCQWPRRGANIIYVNFATHRPGAAWIENLNEGGRLLMPIGVPEDSGFFGGRHALLGLALMVTWVEESYAAKALGPASFIWVDGGHSPQSEDEVGALRASLKNGGWHQIRSLVWGTVPDKARCWFAGADWALSFDEATDRH